MNVRNFLVVILQILSIADAFSVTGIMKFRGYRQKQLFVNAKHIGLIRNRKTIVSKIAFPGNNLVKFTKKSTRKPCINCKTRRSRLTRWSKRFQ